MKNQIKNFTYGQTDFEVSESGKLRPQFLSNYSADKLSQSGNPVDFEATSHVGFACLKGMQHTTKDQIAHLWEGQENIPLSEISYVWIEKHPKSTYKGNQNQTQFMIRVSGYPETKNYLGDHMTHKDFLTRNQVNKWLAEMGMQQM